MCVCGGGLQCLGKGWQAPIKESPTLPPSWVPGNGVPLSSRLPGELGAWELPSHVAGDLSHSIWDDGGGGKTRRKSRGRGPCTPTATHIGYRLGGFPVHTRSGQPPRGAWFGPAVRARAPGISGSLVAPRGWGPPSGVWVAGADGGRCRRRGRYFPRAAGRRQAEGRGARTL